MAMKRRQPPSTKRLMNSFIKPEMNSRDHQQLPSGKQIIRNFNAEGQMFSETHSYGLDISIHSQFRAGVKTSETYIVNKRLVSRRRYDQVREAYPDMPPSDPNVEDVGAELLKAMRDERRQRSKAARSHVPDGTEAARTDAFCQSMLEKGKTANARTWIKSKEHTLGELSHARSRKLIERLAELGAKRMSVCDIDQYDNGEENTGHLVVELPKDSVKRKSLFCEVDRLAAKQGFRGEFDNGQQYVYVGLD
jgi:hypothetical protein